MLFRKKCLRGLKNVNNLVNVEKKTGEMQEKSWTFYVFLK